MAKKQKVIETLVVEKQKELEKKYGYNFHSMYEFEGICKSSLASVKKNVKVMNRMQQLLTIYSSTQDPNEQVKIEATRVELRDNAMWGIEALINLVGALDNFNFSKMLNEEGVFD